MVKVIDQPDCGNAPRREIIRGLIVAIAEKRCDDLGEVIAEDVQWDVVGNETLTGLDEVRHWISRSSDVDTVRFGSVLTHGREGGVDGELTPTEGARIAFCHVFTFSGTTKTAKIRSARTYLIETNAVA